MSAPTLTLHVPDGDWTGPAVCSSLMAVTLVERAPGAMTIAELDAVGALAHQVGRALDGTATAWSRAVLAFDRGGTLVGAVVGGLAGHGALLTAEAALGGVDARLAAH